MFPETQTKRPARLPSGFGFGGHIETSLYGPNYSEAPKNPEEFMLRAIIESMQGAGLTNPNPAVGCLLAEGGTIVAAGATEKWGGRHAERVAFDALRTIGRSTSGLDAYVTLEPCSHHGRQPPCCDLFKSAGISNLFVAAGDPNPLVQGRGLKFVGSEVRSLSVGLCRSAAVAWNFPFFVGQQLGRPLIAAKWAQTLDGAMADASGTSKWITGPEARAHGHWFRLKYDITAVGISTLLADLPALTVRDCWRPHNRQPDVCIVDVLGEARGDNPQLRAALENLSAAAANRKVAVATASSNAEPLKALLPPEWSVLALPVPQNSDGPQQLAKSVQRFWTSQELENWFGRTVQSVFIEGGAKLISLLLEIEAIDVCHTFIAPIVLAGEARRLSRQQIQAPALAAASRFDILSTFLLGDDMLVELVPRNLSRQFFCEG
ncbi:MAG: bifunctional diaminohydroxyphosphoribosylaminopyrimidine deaminase/5-amino-6-(5-phosphoribosylamino)uracil reductase RibD [Proteobacteria bacterium]|nr:bifunctional diaminohydroxyphosphoribosylaminopyrimidine deaminase/5-amino-6-(5-phosphoribosylamino)uracil reductase RibD [Pseudomonadota bacterium]